MKYSGLILNILIIINERSDRDHYYIELLKTGEEAGFAIVYDNYSALLYGIVLRIVRNEEDAQNLLQDTFIKIWQNISQYDQQKGRLATWFINIARNTAIDFTRSKYFSQRSKNQNIENIVVNDSEPAVSSIPVETIGVRSILDYLTPAYRQVIEWMYFDGYTQQEIADKFNMPLGTVKSRARLALKELRTYFE